MSLVVSEPGAPDQLQQFQALEVLRDAAWRSFDTRRSYEWKFSVAVWTALFAAAGSLLTLGATDAAILKGKLFVLWIAVCVWIFAIALHIWWSQGCSLRDDQDRRFAFRVIERHMCDSIGIDYDEKVAPIFAEAPWGGLNYWHTSHVALTFFLGGLVVAAAWLRVSV